MTRRLPRLTRSKGTKLRRAYVWIGHQVELCPAAIFLRRIFRASTLWRVFQPNREKKTSREKQKKQPSLRLHCPIDPAIVLVASVSRADFALAADSLLFHACPVIHHVDVAGSTCEPPIVSHPKDCIFD